jgi:RimJ/RimL family protein N-acetyltransferase
MTSQEVVFLEGKQVILRPMNRATDLEFCQRWINHPDVRHFLTQSLPITLEDEGKWFDSLIGNKSNITLGIVVKESGELIGVMSLIHIDWLNRTAVTGTWIGGQEHRGKGYGTDAKMILLAYAFLTLNLRKICSGAIAFNGASLRFNAKCGYKEEGVLKQQVYKDGQYYDEFLTAVFKDDWLPLWEAYQSGD